MNLNDFLHKVKDLPTISAVANEINTRDRNDSLTVNSLGQIIIRDPALTANVLKLANSPFYGMAREITNLERAVTILGFDAIKNMALTISVFHVFKKQGGHLLNLEDLWHHSLGVALAAKQLALHSPILAVDKAMPEQAFICGLMHDIGKIAFARNLPDEMAEILQQTRSGSIAQHEIEKNILGFNHQRAGQAMAAAWNFPEDYQTVIRLHHTPSAAVIGEPKLAALVMAVYLGNNLAKTLHLGESTDQHLTAVTPEDLSNLKIDEQSLAEISQQISSDYEHSLESWSL